MTEVKKDVVVCGAGYSGICAAVAAARHGVRVALINDRPVLGGNGSSELRVSLSGAVCDGRSPSVYASEGGIIDEIQLELARHGNITGAVIDAVLFDLIYREKNIELFLNTVVTDAEVKDLKIESVIGRQLASENSFRFTAPIFIDCTGDASVGFSAGAEFMYGREAKNEYNENLAPEIADDKVMGDSILFNIEDTGKAVEYIKPEFACDFAAEPFMKNINKPGMYRDIIGIGAQWWLEYGGQCNTVSDNEEIAFKLRSIVYGYWDYIKNSGNYPEADTFELTHVSPVPGKRESRRLKGDYILTQNDIENKTCTEDGVAVGGWKLDIHPPGGIYDLEPATSWAFVDGNYMIPYRCLYSVNISNLFMAGRNVSVTHVALSSTRVMCTCAAMGQAVGTAAYLCVKYQTEPRGIYNNYLEELKTVLKSDNQAMMGYVLPNAETPKSISATSHKKYENTAVSKLKTLNGNICLVLPIMTHKIEKLKVALKNKNDKKERISVVILTGDKIETYRPSEVVRKFDIELEPSFDGWKEIEVNTEVSNSRKIHIVFEKNDNTELYMSEDKLTGTEILRYYKAGEKEHHDLIPLEPSTGYVSYEREPMSVCFKDVVPAQDIFAPQMLFNGFDRPYGLPNCWISEGKGKQYVRFGFTEKKLINEISLVFSTPLDSKYIPKAPRKLIKNYELQLFCEGCVTGKTEIKNNHKRIVKHNFSGVYADEIIFVPKENYGEDYYEMYQIIVNGGAEK